MNIFITGGAGFIGSNLTDALLKQKHNVVCLDNFDDFYDPAIKRSNIRQALNSQDYLLIEGDIRDGSLLGKIFLEHPIDFVIHLAAKAGVRPSLSNPGLYYDVNLIGTLSILEAMKKFNVHKMIMASSSSIYGDSEKMPFSEIDPVDKPLSPYAASKKAAELLCYTYSTLYQFDIFCMRFFTVYGPRQRPEMAIHQFVRKILNSDKIYLYGDGSSRRDYTYVDDIVQGLVNALDRLNGYEIINLGESQPIALRDLISNIESILNRKAIIEWEPGQPGDTKVTFADISKAQRLLNYHPEFSFENGLKNFVEWFLANSTDNN